MKSASVTSVLGFTSDIWAGKSDLGGWGSGRSGRWVDVIAGVRFESM